MELFDCTVPQLEGGFEKQSSVGSNSAIDVLVSPSFLSEAELSFEDLDFNNWGNNKLCVPPLKTEPSVGLESLGLLETLENMDTTPNTPNMDGMELQSLLDILGPTTNTPCQTRCPEQLPIKDEVTIPTIKRETKQEQSSVSNPNSNPKSQRRPKKPSSSSFPSSSSSSRASRLEKLFPDSILRADKKVWGPHYRKHLKELTKVEIEIVDDWRKKKRNCVYAERARQKRIATHKSDRERAETLQERTNRMEQENKSIKKQYSDLEAQHSDLQEKYRSLEAIIKMHGIRGC